MRKKATKKIHSRSLIETCVNLFNLKVIGWFPWEFINQFVVYRNVKLREKI